MKFGSVMTKAIWLIVVGTRAVADFANIPWFLTFITIQRDTPVITRCFDHDKDGELQERQYRLINRQLPVAATMPGSGGGVESMARLVQLTQLENENACLQFS